ASAVWVLTIAAPTAIRNATKKASVIPAGAWSGHPLPNVRSMSAVLSSDFVALHETFVKEISCLIQNALVQAPTNERLDTMKDGTIKDHVAVSKLMPLAYLEECSPKTDLYSTDMEPEDIPLGWYTHINFAFALIDPVTFRMAEMDEGTASRYKRVSALKKKSPGLEVWIVIGGWAMNDPGLYRTTFSDLAKSTANQDKFFDSLLTFLAANDYDGVDIDWEYPVAEDRGGIPEDFNNYVMFLQRLRSRLNSNGRRYGLSLTLASYFNYIYPASYWYLRGFNIQRLEPLVDWFNIMTYDIHGVWDSTVKSIGSYAYAHTNLTEIEMGLNLLWRNNINPERVVLGLGFYGRSFTMKDPSCMTAGCPFTSGANGGDCTGTPGVLSAGEINAIIEKGATVTFDPVAAVKVVTWDSNQWVSWDDAETLKLKIEYANKRCLGGTMVWAIDLDDGTLIEELGGNLNRTREMTFNLNPAAVPDWNWPEGLDKDEL
ncbi:glycoside hydrolase family 18 protein, partial [Colletotrichum incanum]